MFNRASLILSLLMLLALFTATASAAAPVSFSGDVQPILRRSCVACHRPQKMKGKLDLTTYAGLARGGKNGSTIIAGDADHSLLVRQISGSDPQMPEKGQKLSAAEVELLSRWIKEGANDDSASVAAVNSSLSSRYPEVYPIAPVIRALAVSPDGALLAIGGRHEILLHHADGSGIIARLPCSSAQVTSLCFAPDGSRLLAAGGSAGEFGRLDIYKLADRKLLKSVEISSDTLFGMSIARSGDRVCVGCADRTTRVLSSEDGRELYRFAQHTDWVLGTCFNLDGQRIVAAGRDKALWILDLPSKRPFDLVNDPVEPLLCVARDPRKDIVATGAANGVVRLYRLFDLIKTTERDRDPNRVKEIERQPGPVNAIVYSSDASIFAVASTGETRVYKSDTYKRIATCTGAQGGVFSIAFSADGKRLYSGGFEGKLRIYGIGKGELMKEFVPVPMPQTAASKEP